MNTMEARGAALEHFTSKIEGCMKMILEDEGTDYGNGVYEWPNIREWPGYKKWLANTTDSTAKQRKAINAVAKALVNAVTDTSERVTDPALFITETADGETTTKKVQREADSFKITGPTYQIIFSPSGQPETRFPSEDGTRVYLHRGSLNVYCWDTVDFGFDGLYAMAEAAKLCMENKRVTNSKGSIAFYSADQDEVEQIGEKALIELQVPFEHADRR